MSDDYLPPRLPAAQSLSHESEAQGTSSPVIQPFIDDATKAQAAADAERRARRRRMSPEHIRQRKRRRMRRRILIGVCCLIAVILACIVWLMVSAWKAKAEVEAIMQSSSFIQDSVKSGDEKRLAAQLDALSEHIDAAYDQTKQPVWALASLIPYYGSDVQAIRDVVEIMEDVSNNALPKLSDACAELDLNEIGIENGTVRLGGMADVAGKVTAANAIIADANINLSNIGGTHIEPLTSALTQAQQKFNDLAQMMDTANRVVNLLPTMFDVASNQIGVIAHAGGTERVGSMIASSLAERGYDVTMLSFWNHGAPFFPLNEKIHIDYLLQPSEGKLHRTYIYTILKLKHYIKEHQFDILIDIDSELALWTSYAVQGTNCKLVSWEHFNYKHTLQDKRRMHALHLVSQRSAKLVVLTKQDYDLHKEAGFPENKLICIPNPTPFEKVSPSKKSEKMVLAVGRLTEQKGFDLLVQSWSIAAKSVPEWSLAIVGSGENELALKQMAKAKQVHNIEFFPATSHVEEWYDRARVYALSSRYEGFPMVLLEAMSKGLPIVAFDCVTGPRELITDEVNGRLVPDGDVDKFAQCLVETLTDEDRQDRYTKANLKRIKGYSTASITDKWERMIHELVK